MSTAKGTGLVAASVEYSKVAVQITHIRSNQNRTQFERTRMLFDFVRAAFAGPSKAFTDLSRRLRDGVSLSFSLCGPEELRNPLPPRQLDYEMREVCHSPQDRSHALVMAPITFCGFPESSGPWRNWHTQLPQEQPFVGSNPTGPTRIPLFFDNVDGEWAGR